MFEKIKRYFHDKGIIFIETTDTMAVAMLYPDELKCVDKALPSRQVEFATGRWCAHEAIKTLGLKDAPILLGDIGEPLFSDGVVGSIAHSDNIYCAAVANASDILTLGIDIEPISKSISDDAYDLIVNTDEREWFTRSDWETDNWRLLLFSAKESVYKAVAPLVKKRFYFDEVSVFPSGDVFRVRLSDRLSDILQTDDLVGFVFHNEDFLFTAVYI